MIDDSAILAALRTRLLTVTGLPTAANRAWENKLFNGPTIGTPYVSDQYVPAIPQVVTLATDGGVIDGRGLYYVRWYGVPNTGTTAIRTGTNAVLAAFAPGTTLALTGGEVVRVRKDAAPYAGPITQDGAGFAYSVVTIPWWTLTTNVVV